MHVVLPKQQSAKYSADVQSVRGLLTAWWLFGAPSHVPFTLVLKMSRCQLHLSTFLQGYMVRYVELNVARVTRLKQGVSQNVKELLMVA